MADKANGRNSAFELMRITAMFMIVIGHCVMVTAQDQEPYLGTIDNIGWFIKAFTVCAVNLFFLLTGYYAQGKRIRFGKTIELWIKTIFYSVGIYIISCLFGNKVQIKSLIKYLFPITFKTYWYMQVWVVLSLVSPFVAKLLDSINKMTHTILICLLICFFSLHQTLIPVSNTLDQTQGYGISWAIVMFIIGNWIYKYAKTYIINIPALFFAIGYVLCSLTIFASNYLIVKYDIAKGVQSRGNFYAYNSVTVLVQSLCMYMIFVLLSEKHINSSIITKISQNMIAVYLISGHPILLVSLWDNCMNMRQYWEKPFLYVIIAILITLITMVVCVAIDKMMDFVFGLTGLKKKITLLQVEL